MTRWTASLLAVAAVAAHAPAQLPPDKALAAMTVADGLQVELFAAEPMLLNPTSMDVDHKGRVWIAEAVNYRRKVFGRPLLRPEGDRLVVLTDTNGDGKADDATTFYQGLDLDSPIGVCVAPKADGKGLRVFVCQSPDILVFDDADGDLKADGPPKKFLTGFGGVDHDHGVHGINIGPDGKLYFTVGDGGVTGLQGADKKGPVWKSNTTDVQKGTVWRCDQDGGNLELIAHNFRNNYECCVNSFGEVWLSDNDDDGNQQTRICFVMPGGNYGYGPRGPGQTHWHEEQPGIVHKTLRTGFGSPTGITFYEGSLLPEKYRGHLLHTDAGPRELRAFLSKPKGAGYELTKEVLLTSSDNWFRPSDVCVGPDGSVFVADWYDPGVGGHGMGDWTRGRVYRVTPKGHKGYTVPPVKLDTKAGMLAALGSPCQATRALAISTLEAMTAKEAVSTLADGLRSQTSELKARALQLYVTSMRKLADPAEVPAAVEVLNAFFAANKKDDSPFDVLSTRIVTRVEGKPFPADLPYKKEILDPVLPILSKALLREQLIGLRNDPDAEHVKPFVLNYAKQYDGQDHFYRAALNIACGTDPARRDAILADFDKHFPEWNDTVADLVWELRPKSVLPRLEKLLADATTTAAQKARIVDILAASDDATAGVAVLNLLRADHPPEVKARALDNLRLFLPTKWKPLQGGQEITAAIDALLADPKTQATGLQLAASANATNRIDAVAKIATDSKAPAAARLEAVRTLGKLPDDRSVSALMAAGTPENPLSIPAIQALGELLPKAPKPPKYATAAQEALVTGVYADRASVELRNACLAALAGNRFGTGWLLDQQQAKKLPPELVAEAGRLLRNSPFQGERNRALMLFPAANKLDLKKLPPIPELAKRAGNADRGKAVLAATLTGSAQCAKCHTVRGVGGFVGPDLSMIGKKASREDLFNSILDPSKAIADQYVQWSVTTTAGTTVSGLMVADTPQAVTLRDANGKDTTIPKDDIESGPRKQTTSLMPADSAAALTEQELIDLVSYLQTLQTAALSPDAWRVAGPFVNPSKANPNAILDLKLDPEKGPFDPAAKFALKTGEGGWRVVRPNGVGYVDLAALHGDAGAQSVSYAYAELESPADQDAEVLLGTDDGASLFVNGERTHTEKVTRAAAPGQSRVAVKLKKGSNALLLKIANGNNPHGFYLTVLSGQELKPAGKK